MDQQKRFDQIQRKHKKKKHDRSRSKSQHKKRKHSRSRSEKKKDKRKHEKKSPRRDSISEGRTNQKKDKWNQDDKYPQKRSQQRQDRHKKQKKQKKDKYYQRKDQKLPSQTRKQKQRQKSRQKSKKKQSRFQKNSSPYRNGDKKYEKYQDRRQDKRDYDKYDNKIRDKKLSKWDEYDAPKDQRRRDDRRDRDYGRDDRRNNHRDDKKSNWNRFRFDSPPKSDESDMSQDPQKMDKLNRMKAAKQLVTSKADRKLYLGNLPPNITSQQLMDMLNAALKKMQINTQQEGDSIISAWISPDGVGHYAFVQFRSAQQATNGLTLNGASLFGYQLKLGRPKQYIQYNKQLLSQFGTDSNIDTIIKKVSAMGGQIVHVVNQKIICPPTKILVLKHIVTIQELAIDQQYQQIYDDIHDMAKRFGDIKSITIPRPHQVIDLQEVQKRVKGLGYIFVQYKNVDQAKYARKQFISKQFSQRSVACSYFPENKYYQNQLDIQEKVIIQF